ncbi:Undecaprenyl-diphosphatase [Streptomyces violarus]
MSVISVGQAVVLGAVEGVTEFLPVSSTGHLKIVEGLMGIPVDDNAVIGFSAVIQVGAIAAVLVYFFKDIVRIVSAWGRGLRDREERYHHDYSSPWWVICATVCRSSPSDSPPSRSSRARSPRCGWWPAR